MEGITYNSLFVTGCHSTVPYHMLSQNSRKTRKCKSNEINSFWPLQVSVVTSNVVIVFRQFGSLMGLHIFWPTVCPYRLPWRTVLQIRAHAQCACSTQSVKQGVPSFFEHWFPSLLHKSITYQQQLWIESNSQWLLATENRPLPLVYNTH